jgi:hypothetical protein
MVPGAGLEPARLAAGDFESPTSTNFITRADFILLLQFASIRLFLLAVAQKRDYPRFSALMQ